MSDKKRGPINGTANRDVNTVDLVRAGPSEMGALDLEYPESFGLYGDIFEKYLPEIADELIDTPGVRMIVEMEFNCRRIQRMFDQLAVGQEGRLALELIRRDVERLLWHVCDMLSGLYREQWGYDVPGAAHERRE